MRCCAAHLKMDHLQQILNRYRLHHLASLEDGLQGNTRTARGARENAEQALARFREQHRARLERVTGSARPALGMAAR